jgi:hypothetical protein
LLSSTVAILGVIRQLLFITQYGDERRTKLIKGKAGEFSEQDHTMKTVVHSPKLATSNASRQHLSARNPEVVKAAWHEDEDEDMVKTS